MGSTTAQAQVDKKPYKNQTAGWLGVVTLDHLGAQVGVSIEPYGTIYLSDEEAILTARAPRDAKDNPFEEQLFQFQDAQGQVVEQPMRPLVLITDDRDVPSGERYVPGVGTHVDAGLSEATQEANRQATEAALQEGGREVPTTPSEPTLAPSSSAAVPPSHTRPGAPPVHTPPQPEEDVRESWTDNAERTAEPQQGALSGSDQPVGPSDEDPVRDGSPTTQVTQAPAPQPVVATSTVEEHAGVTEKGEETGAADTPVGDAPEGEFASHEEVGSPDAPTQGGS